MTESRTTRGGPAMRYSQVCWIHCGLTSNYTTGNEDVAAAALMYVLRPIAQLKEEVERVRCDVAIGFYRKLDGK